MPRFLAWTCLIVALTGPALSHAEAADDLARSLIGMEVEGQVVPTDGGVGDEPIEASFGPSVLKSILGDPIWSGPIDLATTHKIGTLGPDPVSTCLRRRGDRWPPPAFTRRHVWLQTFLI